MKRIAFIMAHPSDVHFLKFVIKKLKRINCECIIYVRERENIVKALLESENLLFIELPSAAYGTFNRIYSLIETDIFLINHLKKNKIDLLFGRLSPYFAHTSFFLRIPFIAFEDTETTPINPLLTIPFTDTVIVTKEFKYNLKTNLIRVNSYKELAYLHPNYFLPNPIVYKFLNINKNDRYSIIRINAFDAYHDVSKRGFSLKDIISLKKVLEEYSHVFISSERLLNKELDGNILLTPPNLLHSVIYYAHLLVGDTGTCTTEAACLGTPAIRCDSKVGINDLSNFIELEKRYNLIYNYSDPLLAILKSKELIQDKDIKNKWAKRKDQLLNEKIDLTNYLYKLIMNKINIK